MPKGTGRAIGGARGRQRAVMATTSSVRSSGRAGFKGNVGRVRSRGDSGPRPGLFHRPTWQLLLILWAIVSLTYANALNNGFVLDDHPVILDEYRGRRPWEGWAILTDPWGNIQGRPLRTLSFNLDYSLFGPDPRFFHLVNILYHAVNTTLVYYVARRLLGHVAPAFIAALLFAVHPIQTEAVTYISGRKDLLATLFYLAAFSAFLRYRATQRVGALLATVLAFALALLSKESAVTLPAACLLYDWIARTRMPARPTPMALAGAAWQGLREALSRHRLIYLILFGMAIASSLHAVLIVQESERHEYWGGSFGLSLLTTARMFCHYLKLLILPTTLLHDYSFDTFPVTRTYADPASLLAVAALCGIVLALIWCWTTLPTVTFGGLWWFLALLPVAQIVPHHVMMAERFLYLPSVGAALAAGALAKRALAAERRHRLVYAGVGLAAALLAARTVIRNADWKDHATLLTQAVAAAPRGVRTRIALGALYQQRGQYDMADREYQEALRLDPNFHKVHGALASLLAQRGDLAGAEREYLKALRLDPDNNDIRIGLASFYERHGELDKAAREYRELVTRRPRDPLLRQNAGVFYHVVKRDPRRAEEEYQAALALRPQEVEFYIPLAVLYLEARQFARAEEIIQRALIVRPTEPRLHTLLRKVRRTVEGQEAPPPSLGGMPLTREIRRQPVEQWDTTPRPGAGAAEPKR
jgi:Flp pilus assembly protein TadD